MRLVIERGALAFGVISLLVTGCGEGQPATQQFYVEPAPPDNPTARTDAAAAEVTDRESLPPSSPILPVDGSGTTGELTATYAAGQTVLVIQAEDLPEALKFVSHVHRGVCEEGGPVAAALNSVVGLVDGTGTGTTIIGADVLPVTEPLFVQIHGPGGAPIACGNIVGRGS